MINLKEGFCTSLSTNIFTSILIFLFSITPNPLHADTMKHFNLGAGEYNMVLANNSNYDDEFTGYTISALYAYTDNVAARINLFYSDQEDYIKFDNNGRELLALFGTGMYTEGFKIYVSLGIFTEDWELTTLNASHNGIMLGGGIGYNWNTIALDIIYGTRDTSDYQDLADRVNLLEIESAVSMSILLSARF